MKNAVIFDMDGVIIDSEPLWKKAEKEVFSSVGVDVREELTTITASMTTGQVTEYWYKHMSWEGKTMKEVENEVIDLVGKLITSEGQAIEGITELLGFFSKRGFRIGLATNSPSRLIPVVLDKVGIRKYFDAVSSAEFEKEGKPDPAVYLSTSEKLNVLPGKCLVFEDSVSGVRAAKQANMKVVAICSPSNWESDGFGLADLRLKGLPHFQTSHLKHLLNV